jgi:hypothetical protein
MNRVRIAASLLAGGLLFACANPAPATDDDTSALTTPSSRQPTVNVPFAKPSQAHVEYYGGPVISNVEVHTIFWNGKVEFQRDLDSFYGAVSDSTYFDWLTEYDTPKQKIGHGKLAGSFVDTQSSSNVTDGDIQKELARLLDGGSLPAATANDLYMVHFPPGVTVTDQDGAVSCEVFCAYHSSFTHGGKSIFYGVIPDLGGACAGGCGTKSQLENTTSVASHELLESVTDADVGNARSVGPPLAWYDSSNGEIADICVGQTATVAGYNVQLAWSNAANACVAGSRSGGGGGSGGSGGGGASCDESEPNDDATQANTVCSAGTMSGVIKNGSDVDWYEWEVSKGARYTVTLGKRGADFDVWLYHAAASGRLTLVDKVTDPGDKNDETLSHKSSGGGRYLAKVFSPTGAHSTKKYALSVSSP